MRVTAFLEKLIPPFIQALRPEKYQNYQSHPQLTSDPLENGKTFTYLPKIFWHKIKTFLNELNEKVSLTKLLVVIFVYISTGKENYDLS